MAKTKKTSATAAKTETVAGNPQRKLVTVAGPEAPTYYVNNVTIDLSSFDVRLRLGQIQSGDNNELRVKDVAYVFMSHAHARALVTALTSSVAKLPAMAASIEKAVSAKPH